MTNKRISIDEVTSLIGTLIRRKRMAGLPIKQSTAELLELQERIEKRGFITPGEFSELTDLIAKTGIEP